MKIIQLTCHFQPNIGGVETHLSDLVNVLAKRENKVFVLTYRPLTTVVRWKVFEKQENIEIFRIPWFSGLFYSFVRKPVVEFLYLFPPLFLVLPFIILGFDPDVIHAHGLVAGAVGVFWGKILGRKVVISLHSIYDFPRKGLYRKFVELIFNNSDKVLGLSNQSQREIEDLVVDRNKAGKFTYWVDLNKFKRVPNAKEKLGLKSQFIVFCASRLVPEKGIRELLGAASLWNGRIELIVSSDGPLKDEVLNYQRKYKNIKYVGRLLQNELVLYYSASNLLIIPSIHEEGFGRVILEALACGTAVIGANRGAIPEAMDVTVGRLISVSPKNIKDAVEYFYKNPSELEKRSKNASEYARTHYSEKNVDMIISSY